MSDDVLPKVGGGVDSRARGASGAEPDVPAVPGATDIEVEPDKLLDVAEVVQRQADALRDRVRGNLEALRIDEPAVDIVSRHAVDGWNTLVAGGAGSYYQRVLDYVGGLEELAAQLRAAGEQYRASDEDKAAAIARAGDDGQ